jgi:hypothetical protein
MHRKKQKKTDEIKAAVKQGIKITENKSKHFLTNEFLQTQFYKH